MLLNLSAFIKSSNNLLLYSTSTHASISYQTSNLSETPIIPSHKRLITEDLKPVFNSLISFVTSYMSADPFQALVLFSF